MRISPNDGSVSYVRGCRTKVGFRTRAEAKREAKIRRPGRPQKLYVYACRHCGLHHLSSRPPRDTPPDRLAGG